MDSHIQLPKQILRHFCDETRSDKKIHYLDIPTGEIRYASARSLGTAPDYFSENVERFWDSTVESPLGVLNKKARSFCGGECERLTITVKDVSLAKRYIKSALVRSGVAYDSMVKNSFTAAFCSEQENHNDLAVFGMNSNGTLEKYLENYTVTVLSNQTERNFVVPRNCFYTIPFQGETSIVAPISPKAALLLLPSDVHSTFGSGYAVVDSPEKVEKMNLRALVDEYIYNSAFVASNCREELEPLQRYLHENREDLAILKHQR